MRDTLYKNPRLWISLASVVIALIWASASHGSLLRPLEELLIDTRFRSRGPLPSPLKLIYVDIDQEAILELGSFPWDRGIFARTCEALVTHGGVKGIGIDIVFSEAGVPNIADREKIREGHRQFGRYLWGGPPVVLAVSYAGGFKIAADGTVQQRRIPQVGNPHADDDSPELPEWPIGPVVFTPPNVGLIDIEDSLTRTVPLFAPAPGRTYHHLSVELARLHWGLRREDIHIFQDRLEFQQADGTVVRSVPLRDGQTADINWFSPWLHDSNPRVSIFKVHLAAEMIKSEHAEEREAAEEFFRTTGFKDAIVLIGPVDPLMQDLATTSFDSIPAPKVGVHGNMLKTLVSGRFLWEPPRWAEVLIVMLLAAVVVPLIVSPGKHGSLVRFGGVLILGCYAAFAFSAFAQWDWVLPLTAPAGATFTAVVGGLVAQLVVEQKQKRRIKSMFGTYLAPSVVSQMVDSGQEPQLGGVEEEITAYFSDVQSFSTFSEVLPPARLVELMNEYLTACTDIVQAEGGTLDKYIGDAVVAMYGAPLALPTHAHKTCVAALRVQRRIAELRWKWAHEPEKKWPAIVLELQTRIGLNSGRAVVGNMGSNSRFSYTMMGDTVNLAARMESGAKFFGVYTMCTEATRQGCEAVTGHGILFRALGRIVVKGRVAPVPVYELMGMGEDVTPHTRAAVALFEEGLACYQARDWDAALEKFTASAELEPNQPGKTPGVKTNPSLVYQSFVRHLKANPPPADWDGSYTMSEK